VNEATRRVVDQREDWSEKRATLHGAIHWGKSSPRINLRNVPPVQILGSFQGSCSASLIAPIVHSYVVFHIPQSACDIGLL
jgi:hypothetical protein